ncbi:Amidase (plasmid) [Sodalis praecaptivus]|uniref:Amidase n=2 Tax=Sodalis praecaptivus TaxID=1239307 RepID=W0I4I9_9GAMM|nr:Amidase [Sodalis praecaptivus]
MSNPAYEPAITALLCIDLYNDFLAEGGKLFPFMKDIALKNNMHENLRNIVAAARAAGITVYHVPHHRWQQGDYADWKYPTPYQLAASERQVFAKGTWGGTFHDDFPIQPGDIVATEHWGSSGFPNTDLEHKLKRYGKEKIICVGLLANTCLEATARMGMELGFHVTLVRDATSARSHEALHAAMDIDGPTYATEILSTAALIDAIRLSAANAVKFAPAMGAVPPSATR